MRPRLEELEPRDLPSATLLGSTLFVVEQGPGAHTVSAFAQGTQINVTEGDGIPAHDVTTSFAAGQVSGLWIQGALDGPNVIQNLTGLPSVILGGNQSDTAFGGSGRNWIDLGGGSDIAYAILPASPTAINNYINTAGDGAVDQVFTNYSGMVNSDPGEQVVRFFGPGRTPGLPFLGFDPSLNDGVLYITTPNTGSSVVLYPGADPGDVRVQYNFNDGRGTQFANFSGVKFVSYFGGSGDDAYVNQTKIGEAAYGGAGNDLLMGGFGDLSILKGLGGNDLADGRAKHNDLSGNAGADIVFAENGLGGNVYRVDGLDYVAGRVAGDMSLSP